ncbi:ATP-binding protein [Gallaecimonas xiamenensis]|uniref:Transcriptional regulator n=1 Tax=Gallaecimonas xiamenensis 3-C-1 TaxID=745411 RepID=K2JIP7_9GAMM|nr:winged helix-turn-helix domain-containing protein [Gallaecimonas xiamenensis]EKE75113.1 transcriptional regulator [Gallaecimonas xiamenensis 3-C-1]
MQTLPPLANKALRFGPFLLYPDQRLLMKEGEPLNLGGKAMDILLALLQEPGALVSKGQLMARVWPTTVVDEISVRVHIAALRKALGDSHRSEGIIATLPQQGYRFVAKVRVEDSVSGAPRLPLPSLLWHTLGRDEALGTLKRLLLERRLLTLVGCGGIGKTTVALRVAEQLKGDFGDGIHFLDLATIDDHDAVAKVLAQGLGLAPGHGLAGYFEGRQLLLVLDNCEHLVGPCASLVERLLRLAPGLRVLATSREPLRAEGESVLHLGPLPYPVACDSPNASEAISYAAIELFLARAQARLPQFSLDDDNVAAVAAICRRLDGIPLAIELAAANVEALGLDGICAQLDDGMRLLSQGRRHALKRHQTLEATLDWSYGLLSDSEQRCFRLLAIFNGAFSLNQALELLNCGDACRATLLERVTQLVSKSLLEVDRSGPEQKYRLLDTTRSYALDKLKASDDVHHLCCLGHLRQTKAQ